MPNKLTDAEIKKALECCKKDDCDNCPNDFGNCYSNLSGYALDLINRQEAEKTELLGKIEQLKKDKVLLSSEISRLNSVNQMNENHIQKLKAEVERLQNTIAIFTQNSVDFANEIKRQKEDKEDAFQFAADIVNAEKIVIAETKTEAYKEVFEKLKEKLRKLPQWNVQRENYKNVGFSYDDVFFSIEKTKNELVGDGDGKRKD